MPYIFVRLKNICHFHCFRVHIYTLLVLQNVLLAFVLGITEVYSVDIFSSFNVLCSRWCSIACV